MENLKKRKKDIKIKINKASIATQVSGPSLYQFLVLIKSISPYCKCYLFYMNLQYKFTPFIPLIEHNNN
jgi:hypothetical protein